MDNKKGLLLLCSIVILSISIIITSKNISDAIKEVGLSLSSMDFNNSNNGNYEVIVKDGWIYLYDTNNGQIWKRSDDQNSNWETVKHYTQ